jgi:hypothetical protein
MINPTTQAPSQFNAPYNIIPDMIYTNPTNVALSQFTTPLILGQYDTYNILPDTIFTNATINAPAQFATPLVLGQFNTYNILPDTIYTNPTIGIAQFSQPITLGQYDTFNYVTSNDIITPNTMLPSMQQFTQSLTLGQYDTFNYTSSNDFIPNPTIASTQFTPTTVLGTEPTFNYTSSNDFIPNPTIASTQFTPTTVLGTEPTFNYTSSNDFIPNPFNGVQQGGFPALSQSQANPTLVNNTYAPGSENPGVVGTNEFTNEQVFISQFTNNFSPKINVDPAVGINTNITPKSIVGNAIGYASSLLGSISGIPQIGQVGQTAAGMFDSTNSYLTLAKDRLTRQGIRQWIKYPDFRSTFTFPEGDLFNETNSTFQTTNQTIAYFTSRRIDGLAASTRLGMEKSWKSIAYAAAAATPVGPYSVFNLDGFGNTGYGYGDHDNPDAFRNDFTIRSHVATVWRTKITPYSFTERDANGNILYKSVLLDRGRWGPTLNPTELVTPFRGDKVTVIDFGKRTLKDAYRWKPKRALELFDKQSLTQDFIKFYLTGPKLHNGLQGRDAFADPDGYLSNFLDDPNADDIIVFRAHITNLDDSFQSNWTPVTMIGRADPNYIYTGMTRDVSVSFDIYATDRDEVKPIWRKLNALAGYTAPTYDPESIAMIASWMRITIGDLFVQQPVTLTSLSYQFAMDAPWEINIEEDPTMMQVPLKIGVSLQFNMISDYMPQKGGRFYTLAKRFDETGTPKRGSDNWLSDFRDNVNTVVEMKQQETFKLEKDKTVDKAVKLTTYEPRKRDINSVVNNTGLINFSN